MAASYFPRSTDNPKTSKAGAGVTGAEPLSGEAWNTAAPTVRGYAAKVS